MKTVAWEDDGRAIDFLRSRGYKLTRSYHWIPPADHEPTADELGAMRYLFEEWDFGGILAP